MILNLDIKPELQAELSAMAKRTHRDEQELVNEAIQTYITRENHMQEKIKEGLAQAENLDFVPDKEMDAFFDQIWLAESHRRTIEIDKGSVQLISAEELERRIQAILH